MINSITPLELTVHNTIPLVYDDSMTYLELLGAVVAKINEMAAVQNAYFNVDLRTNVINILTEWQTNGTLNLIINTALQSQLDDVEVNVKTFGAVGNGTTDDSISFQNTINYCITNGKRMKIPEGVFLINTSLNIFDKIEIEGNGWEEFAGAWSAATPAVRGKGSWIYTTNPLIIPFNIVTGANTVRIRNIAFDQPKPAILAGWAPTAYKECINSVSGSTTIENVLFFGVYKGIQIGSLGVATGRSTIKHVFGECFNNLIDIQFSADTVVLDDIHIYPFWSQASVIIMNYTKANANGIISRRNDNPMFSNIFVSACNNALLFTSTTDGSTSKLHASNLDIDFCRVGVKVDGGGTTLQFSNLTIQPGPELGLTGSSGILVTANVCLIEISNLKISRCNNNAISLQGAWNILQLVNVSIDYWNESGIGYPGIEAGINNVVSISNTIHYSNGGTADVLGGSGIFNGGGESETKVYKGTLDGSGALTIAHGKGALAPERLMEVEAYYKDAGAGSTPLTLLRCDGTNVTFSGGLALAYYRVTLKFSLRGTWIT